MSPHREIERNLRLAMLFLMIAAFNVTVTIVLLLYRMVR